MLGMFYPPACPGVGKHCTVLLQRLLRPRVEGYLHVARKPIHSYFGRVSRLGEQKAATPPSFQNEDALFVHRDFS